MASRTVSMLQRIIFRTATRISGAAALSVATVTAAALAQSEPIVHVTISDSLQWGAVDASTGATADLGTVGVVGDNLLLGRWIENGREIGVTHVDGTTGAITWRVRTTGGEIIAKEFGQKGDSVLSSADFDGSGYRDAAVVRSEGRKLHWYVKPDLFAGGTQSFDFLLGAKGESPFFLRFGGVSDMAATIAPGQRTMSIRLYDPRSGGRKIVRGFKPLSSALGAAKPGRLRGADGRDRVLIVQQNTSVTTLTVLDLANRSSFYETLPAVGDVVVGDFLASSGEEVAVRAGDSLILFNPFDGSQSSIPAVGDVLVDYININATGEGAGGGSKPVQPPVNDAPPSADLASLCASVSPILPKEMLIKSEASKHINRADPRAAGYTVVCGTLCPANLDYVPFYYSNGELAGAVAYYGRFSGNNKPRLYGGVGKAPAHSAYEIARRASTIGNGKLYLLMSAESSGPATICKEFAPTGRNGSL